MDAYIKNPQDCDICVVVPAYNEETVIGKVVRGIINCGYKNVIVVDDGSTDRTFQIASASGAAVYRHKINRGKGAAVKTGLMAAQMGHAKIVVTIDGDGQHDPLDISLITQPLISGLADVVLGARSMDKGEMPLIKVYLNKVGNFFIRVMTGVAVLDSQSGFRAYNAKVLDCLYDVGDKYEYDSEIIRQIRRYGLRFKEVPIRVYYTKYSTSKVHRQSLENGIKTSVRMIWNIFA